MSTALAISFASFLLCAGVGRFKSFESGDTERYVRLAGNIVQHGIYSSCTQPPYKAEVERMPGYPLFLAAVRSIAPEGWYPIVVAQALLQGIATLAVFLLAFALTDDRRFAHLSAAGWALYPYSIYYALSFLSEALATPALAVAAAAFVIHLRSGTWSSLATSTAGVVVASFTRPNLLGVPIFVLAVVLVVKRLRTTRAIRAAAIMSLVLILAFVPWAVRNQREFGRFMLGSHNYLGSNLCQASVQFILTPEEIRKYCLYEEYPVLNECDPEKSQAVDVAWVGRAREAFAEHPALTLSLALFRPIRIWFSYHIDDPRGANAWLVLAMRFFGLGLLPLFLGGLYLLWRETRNGWVATTLCLYISLSDLPFPAAARYSMPARPCYVVAVVYLAYALALRLKVMRRRTEFADPAVPL